VRGRLWPFVLVGLLATAVDYSLLLILFDRGFSRTMANVVALALAAVLAYTLNRLITFRGDTTARWVRHPGLFAITAVSAGWVDITVLSVLDEFVLPLAVAKIFAIGAGSVVRFSAYRFVLLRRVRKGQAQRVARPEPDRRYRLSVIVPAYNESSLITRNVGAIESTLLESMPRDEFEIVVVDDGSADNTVELAEQAGARVVRQPENRGKGAAIRAGVLAAEGRAVVFTDADLAYSPDHIPRVLAEIEDGWDMVVGSRRHPETTVVTPPTRLRSIGGRLVNFLTYSVLLSAFNDTQCGLKGFQADVARAIFQRTRIDSFAFDIELFLIAEQDGLSIRQIPVTVDNRAESSVVVFAHTRELAFDLVRLRRWVGDGIYLPNAEQRRLLNRRNRAADRDRNGL
jgi:glycosyltransferase involved in cell wall biosynthesis/putative flippase GtrA